MVHKCPKRWYRILLDGQKMMGKKHETLCWENEIYPEWRSAQPKLQNGRGKITDKEAHGEIV